jgi:hypothetical protein
MVYKIKSKQLKGCSSKYKEIWMQVRKENPYLPEWMITRIADKKAKVKHRSFYSGDYKIMDVTMR